MLEIVMTIKGGGPARKRKAAVTKFDKMREAVEVLGVEIIPGVNAVRFGGQRVRLEFDRHNYSIRDLIRVIERKFHFKVSQRLLVNTLQQIRFEKFGN